MPQPTLQQVYLSTVLNSATDNSVKRIQDIAAKITLNLINCDVDVKHMMLIRGYSINTETENCMLYIPCSFTSLSNLHQAPSSRVTALHFTSVAWRRALCPTTAGNA
jgi:hypothetical protein